VQNLLHAYSNLFCQSNSYAAMDFLLVGTIFHCNVCFFCYSRISISNLLFSSPSSI